MKQKLSKITKYQAFWPFMIFIAILLINGIISGGAFFEMKIVDGHLYGRVIDIFRNSSKLMLLSIGMTMVLATGGTDISVGSVMAISGAIACSIINGLIFPWLGGNVAAAVIIAILAGVLCGLWNGFLVAKVKIQPIVATLILMVAGRGLAQLITDGKIITINAESYYLINGGYFLGLPNPVYIALIVLAIVLVFTKKTAFGLFLESTGCNPQASKFSGINVDGIKLLVYTLCGMLAAMAGIFESAGIKCADCNKAGLSIELDAILAVAIGGTSLSGGKFSIPASIAGALIIQSIMTSIYALKVPAEVIQVVKALLIVIICLSQSAEFKQFIAKRFKGRKAVSRA